MVDLSMDLLHCGQTRNLCALNFTQVEAESIGSAAIIDPPGLSWIYTQWEKEFKWYKVRVHVGYWLGGLEVQFGLMGCIDTANGVMQMCAMCVRVCEKWNWDV